MDANMDSNGGESQAEADLHIQQQIDISQCLDPPGASLFAAASSDALGGGPVGRTFLVPRQMDINGHFSVSDPILVVESTSEAANILAEQIATHTVQTSHSDESMHLHQETKLNSLRSHHQQDVQTLPEQALLPGNTLVRLEHNGTETTNVSIVERGEHYVKVNVTASMKPYICTFCDKDKDTGADKTCLKSFKRKSDLIVHVRYHTGEKPYACDWPDCGARFVQSSTKKVHERTHANIRPFICHWANCNHRTTTKSDMRKHQRSHTGAKPFNCPHCAMSFSDSTPLKGHMKKAHGVTYHGQAHLAAVALAQAQAQAAAAAAAAVAASQTQTVTFVSGSGATATATTGTLRVSTGADPLATAMQATMIDGGGNTIEFIPYSAIQQAQLAQQQQQQLQQQQSQTRSTGKSGKGKRSKKSNAASAATATIVTNSNAHNVVHILEMAK